MLSYDEALAAALAEARPLGSEATPLAEAAGRVLAQPVTAGFDFPPAATSAMDGYAVASADLVAGARLRVVGESFAGAPYQGVMARGASVRIFTGAVLPEGADRVMIQEVVVRDGAVAVMPAPPYGASHTRSIGSDFRAGDVLVEAGLELTPQRLVAAAAADLPEVTTWRRPRVAVLSTGDELAEPGQARARPGAIAESISLALLAQTVRWGGQAMSRRICADDLPRLQGLAAELVRESDLVVVCGGASVGERDYSRAMFEPLSLRIVFSKAAIKPGKPVWLGRVGEALVLGLPGNPTSAMVTARLFMAPLLAAMTGRPGSALLSWRSERLDGELSQTDDRETFHRARRTEQGLDPLSDQSSGAQRMLGQADVLIRRRPGEAAAKAGEQVMALDL